MIKCELLTHDATKLPMNYIKNIQIFWQRASHKDLYLLGYGIRNK